jgi:hypothetical protein
MATGITIFGMTDVIMTGTRVRGEGDIPDGIAIRGGSSATASNATMAGTAAHPTDRGEGRRRRPLAHLGA